MEFKIIIITVYIKNVKIFSLKIIYSPFPFKNIRSFFGILMYPSHMFLVIQVQLDCLPDFRPLNLFSPVNTMGRNPWSAEGAQLDLGGVLRGRGSTRGTTVTGGVER